METTGKHNHKSIGKNLETFSSIPPSFLWRGVKMSAEDQNKLPKFVQPKAKSKRPCKYYISGSCKYSDENCRYSHYLPQKCRLFFSQNGRCPYGTSCRFSHQMDVPQHQHSIPQVIRQHDFVQQQLHYQPSQLPVSQYPTYPHPSYQVPAYGQMGSSSSNIPTAPPVEEILNFYGQAPPPSMEEEKPESELEKITSKLYRMSV